MSVNITNLNNLNAVSQNSVSTQVETELTEADLNSNKNKINDLKSDLSSTGASLDDISLSANASENISSSSDDVISLQEENFLNSYTNGELNTYDPRAIVIAGQYILAQSKGQEERLEIGDSLLDITGVYDVNRETGLDLIFQAKEIIDKTEVAGQDTSKQFGSDMNSLFFSYVGDGSTDNEAKPIDSDALNTVFNITDTFETLDGGDQVIIIGGHSGHQLGDLIGDAGGVGGLDNGYGSGNGNLTNDDLFKSVYEKMSQEDRDRLATTPMIVDVNTGKVIGEISVEDLAAQGGGVQNGGQAWADYNGENFGDENSIEGKTINYKGQEYEVVESIFRWYSPLVFDLDGDGIQLTSAEDGAVFDLDGDGKKDKTAWTQSGQGFDDAFLVLDRDANGSIDSGKELFGDQHGAANGYDELAKLDTNKDGKIDANDAAYSELKLWADIDGDGQSDEGELKTLAEMGVTSISTKYTGALGQKKDDFGNDISLESSFTRMVDGEEKTLKTVDAFFVNRDAATAETIETGSIDELTSSLLASFKEYAEIKDASYVAPSAPSNIPDANSESAAQTEFEKELEAAQKAEERHEAFINSRVDSIEGEKSSVESDLSAVESELSILESAPEDDDERITSNTVTSENSENGNHGDVELSTNTVKTHDDTSASNKASAQSRQTYLNSEISSMNSEISRLRASIS